MRIGKCLFALALSLVLTTAHTVRASTVAYYRLGEGANGSVATGTNTVLDSSGNGLNGSPHNGPTYTSNVPVSTIPLTGAANTGAMTFSGSNNQAVWIPDNNLFKTPSFTIEAYVKVTGVPNAAGSIFQRGDDRSGNDPLGLLVNNTQTLKLLFYQGDSFAQCFANYPGLNSWFHVAATFDDTSGVMAVYINGTLMNSVTTALRPNQNLDPAFHPGVAIGSLPSDTYGNFIAFQGSIDEVRLSNTVLPPSQFLNHAGPVPEPSFAVWSFPLFGLLAPRARA